MEDLPFTPRMPRLMLVEDDPITSAFLLTAAQALPASVDCADSVATALSVADSDIHDLWLIDANLPDGSGASLLRTLRQRNLWTPALAHTAATDDATHRALIEAGFLAVMIKPIDVASLHAVIRNALGLASMAPMQPHDSIANRIAEPALVAEPVPCRDEALWNDEIALTALNGQQDHVDALRELFLDELPQVHGSIIHALQAHDMDALSSVVHKLRASCGFVGASRLLVAASQLTSQSAGSDALSCFDSEVARLLLTRDKP